MCEKKKKNLSLVCVDSMYDINLWSYILLIIIRDSKAIYEPNNNPHFHNPQHKNPILLDCT